MPGESRTYVMRRRHRWAALRDAHLDTPERRASYADAQARLNACWTVVCREGMCVWWVSPDSSQGHYLSGVGPVDCPCKRNDP
jgi:hypothetical protein